MRRAGGGVTARPRNKGREGLMADRRISGRTHGTARFRAALDAGGIMLAIASVGVAVHAKERTTGHAPVDLADQLIGTAALERQELRCNEPPTGAERKSDRLGKKGSVRIALGGRRLLNKNNTKQST